jgi:CNT family concentrative nucleoside transporter
VSDRALLIVSYALSGFAHLASVGIFVGGTTALVPSRRKDISELGWKSLFVGTLATIMIACVAGVFDTGARSILGEPSAPAPAVAPPSAPSPAVPPSPLPTQPPVESPAVAPTTVAPVVPPVAPAPVESPAPLPSPVEGVAPGPAPAVEQPGAAPNPELQPTPSPGS